MTGPPEDPKTVAAAEAARVSSLRMQMLEMHPFWGYLLLQVQLVPAPGLASIAATDCLRHIWYNPGLTRHLSIVQLGFVLAHEVGHQLFASEDRRRGRSHHLWNCATDYAINRIVADIANPAQERGRGHLYAPPEGDIPGLGKVKILLDPRWKGMIAEAIYEYLASKDLPEPVSVTLVVPGDEEDEGQLRIPNLTDHGGGIDVHLPDSLTPNQRDELVGRLVGAFETWERQQQAGDIPGNLVREIIARHRSAIPWQRLFRQFAGEAIHADEYSLQHPNRRYLADDLVVPGLYTEKTGSLVVSLDTSGSMSGTALQAVGSELRVLKEQAVEMTLLIADAKVHEVVGGDRLDRFLEARRFRGGGGTDHRPVFDWIRQSRRTPDLYIGMTDLYSKFPDRRPAYPVVWLVPQEHGKAPWGRVIEVKT